MPHTNQPVGFARHGRYHDRYLMASSQIPGNALRYLGNALGTTHTGAAVFLNDQSHVFIR